MWNRSPFSSKAGEKATLCEDFSVKEVEILRSPNPRLITKVGDKRLVLREEAIKCITPIQKPEFYLGYILICRGELAVVSQASAYWKPGVQPAESEDRASLFSKCGRSR